MYKTEDCRSGAEYVWYTTRLNIMRVHPVPIEYSICLQAALQHNDTAYNPKAEVKNLAYGNTN